MHKFLKAAGFDALKDKDIYEILYKQVICRDCLSGVISRDGNACVCEYRKGLNGYIGLCAAVLSIGENIKEIIYYYPYYISDELSSESMCTVERHTMTETYAGVIDEYSLGISIIFFVNNPLDLMQRTKLEDNTEFKGTYLTAFANEGMVILPVASNEEDTLYGDTAALNREELIEAAFGGDEEAIETLTASEISMFQELSDRIENEDLYSVVEQSFMPCGVECDQYSIIGEIVEVDEDENIITNEGLWLLKISCNDISFRLCITKKDLLGEPMKGRRIKCRIWMQGMIEMQK